FGTDGVRGVANKELSCELAYKLGKAGAYVLAQKNKHKAKIIVGMDTRISGAMLEAALTAGICSVGAEVISLGVIPTPGVAYLVRKYGADAGVVISASHNPVKDNGIKFFNSKGFKLSDEIEDEIEDIMINHIDELPLPTGIDVGTRRVCDTSVSDYSSFVAAQTDTDLSGIKIVCDCANGATSAAAKQVFKALNADVTYINAEPDGTNINLNCGSTHMESLKEAVVRLGADVGVAFDGDGDRCLCVDEKGETVDGDMIMAIIGNDFKDKGILKDNTITATVMSNLGFMLMAEERGLNIAVTDVGDRYVIEEMLKNNHNLGGEQSGHVIILDKNTTGDGLLTAVTLLSVVKKKGEKLSVLKSIMEVLPQVLVNAKVDGKKKNEYNNYKEVRDAIEALNAKFSGEGRVLIRPSGTEPLVRVMIEGRDIDVITEEAEKLAALIVEALK
ncbi:MAG: phosphoglucosamine mutase, partial [Clostridiales bacterium]|nr:phosphoglucosamine mutase [Clostridiales bacterium]